MKLIEFLKKLFVGNSTNECRCEHCGSTNLNYYNETIDGFYIEFKCSDCKKTTII